MYQVLPDNDSVGFHGGVLPWPISETHPSEGNWRRATLSAIRSRIIARRVARATDAIASQIRQMKSANPARFFRH